MLGCLEHVSHEEQWYIVSHRPCKEGLGRVCTLFEVDEKPLESIKQEA